MKRSIVIAGHATSLSLEPEFWDALKEIAAARHMSLAALVGELDAAREADMVKTGRAPNLSSYLRVHVLGWLRAAAKG